MPQIPTIPATSVATYLGVIFVIFGIFLVLAGTGIIKINKVTVKQGRKTWIAGILLAVFGFMFLLSEYLSGATLIPKQPQLSLNPCTSSKKVGHEGQFAKVIISGLI